jgi:hypothetical protein
MLPGAAWEPPGAPRAGLDKQKGHPAERQSGLICSGINPRLDVFVYRFIAVVPREYVSPEPRQLFFFTVWAGCAQIDAIAIVLALPFFAGFACAFH